MLIYVLRSGITDISWLTLYIDSPLLEESDSEVDVSERILKKFFISKNLEKSPIYAYKRVLAQNSEFIYDYCGKDVNLDQLNCKDILMTEEQYQFFDKLFNNINNSWERFVEAFSCYRMIFNKEQLSKKYSELIKSYKPFEFDIEQWCNRIDKMNETVEKDLKKLIK